MANFEDIKISIPDTNSFYGLDNDSKTFITGLIKDQFDHACRTHKEIDTLSISKSVVLALTEKFMELKEVTNACGLSDFIKAHVVVDDKAKDVPELHNTIVAAAYMLLKIVYENKSPEPHIIDIFEQSRNQIITVCKDEKVVGPMLTGLWSHINFISVAGEFHDKKTRKYIDGAYGPLSYILISSGGEVNRLTIKLPGTDKIPAGAIIYNSETDVFIIERQGVKEFSANRAKQIIKAMEENAKKEEENTHVVKEQITVDELLNKANEV